MCVRIGPVWSLTGGVGTSQHQLNMETSSQRLVYLLTYSKVDLERFPSRESFAEVIKYSFECKGLRLLQWVVSLEPHKDGGYHYHMALKLSKRSRWLEVKRHIQAQHSISVNFSEGEQGATYYSAFNYVTKEDKDYVLSSGHPDVTVMPKTTNALLARNAGNAKTSKKGRKRMSEFEFVQVVQNRKLSNRLEVMALAANLQKQGNNRLVEFIANRGVAKVDNAVALAKELEEAPKKLMRLEQTRIQILQTAQMSPCVNSCEGQWKECAEQLLKLNGIGISVFATAVHQLLLKGRGKYRNIYIHGPANCGKTFLLQPLREIYATFSNPAHGTFAWVGADESEIIFLNDFRWNSTTIAWQTFLLLLEGDIAHLPAPKNAHGKDIEIRNDTPIFATADMPIVLARGGIIDQVNTRMMQVRWRYFELWKVISESERKELNPCAHCFADLILGGIQPEV